jgi:hypothetical protein
MEMKTMTILAFHRLRICMVTMGLVVGGEAYAACTPAPCVNAMVKWNVALANLHPSATHLQIRCDMAGASKQPWSERTTIVNRAYVGQLAGLAEIPAVHIANQANHSMNIYCSLWLSGPGGDRIAVAKSALQNITDSNWNEVATGSWSRLTPSSALEWLQEVTFPNVSANAP